MPKTGLSARFEYLPVYPAWPQPSQSTVENLCRWEVAMLPGPARRGGMVILSSARLCFFSHVSFPISPSWFVLSFRLTLLHGLAGLPHQRLGPPIHPRYRSSKTGAWCYWGFGVLGAWTFIFCFFKILGLNFSSIPWAHSTLVRGKPESPPSVDSRTFLS